MNQQTFFKLRQTAIVSNAVHNLIHCIQTCIVTGKIILPVTAIKQC